MSATARASLFAGSTTHFVMLAEAILSRSAGLDVAPQFAALGSDRRRPVRVRPRALPQHDRHDGVTTRIEHRRKTVAYVRARGMEPEVDKGVLAVGRS